MAIFHHRGSGDVLVVIYLKMSYLHYIRAGARRKSILDPYPAYLHIHVDKRVASTESYRRNVRIRVNSYVTLVLVHLARISVPFRVVIVERSLLQGGALRQITTLDGVVGRSAETLCRAANTLVSDLVTKDYVELVKLR